MKESQTHYVQFQPKDWRDIKRDMRFAPLMANGEEQSMWEITREVRFGEIIHGDQLTNVDGLFFAHKLFDPNDLVFNLEKGKQPPMHFYKPIEIFIRRSKWRVLWEAIKGLFK